MGHSPLVHLQTYGRRIERPALLRKVAALASARQKPVPEKQQSPGVAWAPEAGQAFVSRSACEGQNVTNPPRCAWILERPAAAQCRMVVSTLRVFL
jgi:hypothetical protein